MPADPVRKEKERQETEFAYRRIGHKGADAIRKGNTLESFEAAVECGVDVIELDVLRDREGRLIVAHDPEDALRRRPLDLTEALDAFLEPSLDKVEIDCDLKLPGREAELAGALQGRGLLERAMVSTMEVESVRKLRQMEPDLRLGWTYPKTKRDWAEYGWASPALGAALSAIRRRFPAKLARQGPELRIDAVWAYHPIITPRLVSVTRDIGVELIAWTVDDVVRMRELIAMGVDGICSNDPRLFEVAEREPLPAEDRAEPDAEEEPRRRRLFGIGRKRGGSPEEAEEAG
ncbi:MAG TPA: glycerophosphodiester phosphodiesterase [Solirubrobacterales bacterium]|nr:glycerophosphodiester phosphodiesterase [Solirubrobacterales bacterium]